MPRIGLAFPADSNTAYHSLSFYLTVTSIFHLVYTYPSPLTSNTPNSTQLPPYTPNHMPGSKKLP